MAEKKKFYEYLSSNGIDGNTIENMQIQKINPATISFMDTDELAKYLPSEGDRLLARNYSESSDSKPLTSLLDRLRSKFNQKKPEPSPSRICEGKRYKNAVKNTRKIEIGWMDYDFRSNSFKQVRGRTGGGTRHVEIDKMASPSDVLNKAKELFFPQNRSARGMLQSFESTIMDFKMQDMDDLTVGGLYEKISMRVLRFYLCTKKITHIVEDSDTDSLPEVEVKVQPAEEAAASSNNVSEIMFGPTQDQVAESNETTIPLDYTHEDMLQGALYLSVITNEELDDLDHKLTSAPGDNSGTVNTPEVSNTLPFGYPLCSTPVLPYQASTWQLPGSTSQPSSPRGPTPPPFSPLPSLLIREPEPYTISIKRDASLDGMIAAFHNNDILNADIVVVSMLMPNGKKERGEGIGVLADCLTGFWEEFYENCTLGTHEKIPCLRHDFKENEWKAIGRILLFGWQKFGFLPVQLSKLFVLAACGIMPDDIQLTRSFAQYIGDDEKQIIEDAIRSLESVDLDDLLDVLGRYGCKTLPKQDNIHDLVSEIAHKELIQQPMFILDSWRSIYIPEGGKSLIDTKQLEHIYEEAMPRPRTVLKRLVFPEDMNAVEKVTADCVMRYVREADSRKLKLLLRFCTGYNILVKRNEKIKVMFSAMSDFCRRPIGHTCGMTLEVCQEYASYTTFRTEMNMVLDSGFWNMDIV